MLSLKTTGKGVNVMSQNSPWQYFTVEELTCRCGCGVMQMSEVSMQKFVAIRRMTGIAMPITSAYRCPKHNNNVSGTGFTGPHTTGQAIDVSVSGGAATVIISMALVYGISGLGVKQNGPYDKRFLHLDDLPQAPGQPRAHIWSY